MPKLALHWQVLIALGLAVLAGWLSGTEGTIFGLRLYAMYDFLGSLFLNALKMLIIPLIVSSVIVGAGALVIGRSEGETGILRA